MYDELLPIGSVVLLKEAKLKLVIVGRILTNDDMKEIFDYAGVIYPLGITGDDELYFFNRDAIDRLYFIGFQDGEELEFKEEVLSKLGELTIKDGQIVPVEE